MGDNTVHYKLRFTNWHKIKCLIRYFCSIKNEVFDEKFIGYTNALVQIDVMEGKKKARIKSSMESFTVYRTDVPQHIPPSQRLRYVSTPKITDI